MMARLYSFSLYLIFLTDSILSRPLKVFSKGFSGKHLPPGGWTQWFNIDHPGGAGDFETYASIVRMYGRTCMGIPCRKPIAVKVVSVYGLSPSETGNQVRVSARRGISCYTSHQHNSECADYKVRFYCRNLHLKCNRSKYYPQHWGLTKSPQPHNTTNITAITDFPLTKYQKKKMKILQKKLTRKDGDLTLVKEENEILRIKKKKRRKKEKPPKKRKLPEKEETKEEKAVTPFLAYHPRHPRFL